MCTSGLLKDHNIVSSWCVILLCKLASYKREEKASVCLLVREQGFPA